MVRFPKKVALSFVRRGKSKFTQFESQHSTITEPGSEGETEFTQLLIYCSLRPFHFPFQNYCIGQARGVYLEKICHWKLQSPQFPMQPDRIFNELILPDNKYSSSQWAVSFLAIQI